MLALERALAESEAVAVQVAADSSSALKDSETKHQAQLAVTTKQSSDAQRELRAGTSPAAALELCESYGSLVRARRRSATAQSAAEQVGPGSDAPSRPVSQVEEGGRVWRGAGSLTCAIEGEWAKNLDELRSACAAMP